MSEPLSQPPALGVGPAVSMLTALSDNVARVIRGKRTAIELTVAALVAGGHILVDDIPGVGKTTLAKALARSIAGDLGRVQFTPDLLPTDLLGTSIWRPSDATFMFRPGPLFTNILLADEINRASAKTQSALLEAMAEHAVTVDGETRPLPAPFFVIATQNPAEQHGTHPLPESQLDRFILRLSLGYPSRDDERAVLVGEGQLRALETLQPVVDLGDLAALSATARRVHVDPAVIDYILDLADATRRHPDLALGASPRAAIGLYATARVWALRDGRTFVSPDDVRSLVGAAWAHRVWSRAPGASSQHTQSILAAIVDSVAAPRRPAGR